jgi:hypothetical protein
MLYLNGLKEGSYRMPNYRLRKTIDITSEVNIKGFHIVNLLKYPMFKGTIRIVMREQCKTIGVLKSTEWDMFPGYRLIHIHHPDEVVDDSWFKVLKTTTRGDK